MSHSHITAILNQTDSFPVLPATVNRVIEITGIPESSANTILLPEPLTWDNMEVSFDDMEITFDQIEF